MPHHALLVDDDIHTLFLFEQILRPSGLSVLKAEDGIQALEILNLYTPVIVFLDLLLPRVNGLEVLNFIIETPRLNSVMVVVISSQSRSLVSQSAPLARAQAYFMKPINPKDIRAATQQAIAGFPE